MNEHELRDAYERVLQAKGEAQQSPSLPLDRLQSLVSGDGSEAERLRALDIAMSTVNGRREFEVAWAASRAAQIPRRHRFSSRWLAAAAALLLTTTSGVVWWLNPATHDARSSATTEVMRGANVVITLIMPRKELANGVGARFVWLSVPSAERYKIILVDEQGNDVFETITSDTAITLPESVSLRSGDVYFWWVQSELTDGTTATAVTEKFTVTGRSRP